MAERADARTWMQRGLFVALAFLIVVLRLVPLDLRPPQWAAPDLLLAITLVWVARQPRYLPLPVIAILFLSADLLFMRPPGLWTALVVILTETLRHQHRDIRHMSLLGEWGTVAIGIVAVTVVNRLILTVAFAPLAPLGLTVMEMVTTILIYPVVALAAQFLLGISRTAPGEMDARGHRL